MTIEERGALLARRLPFFHTLGEELRGRLADGAGFLTLSRGDTVCGMRGRCIGLLLPVRGRARAFIRSAEGREITLCRPGAGDVFVMPASGLFGLGAYDVTLECESYLEALLLDPHLTAELVAASRDGELFLLKESVRWLSLAMQATGDMLLKSLEARLCSFLLGEVDRHGGDTVYLTQEEIARHIGSAREAVSRTLKALATRGLLVVLHGGVRLLDAAGLRTLAG